MEIKDMTMEQVEERANAIATEMEAEGADLEALNAEVEALQERKNAILARAEERKAELRAAAEEVITNTVVKENNTMEREIFGIDSKEYRNAFYSLCQGRLTTEERAIFADNSTPGDGYALPTQLDTEIWDAITTAHPILADVDAIAFGTAIKVTQATPAGVTKKKDSDPVAEMSITFHDETLAGNDYIAVVKLSYAEAKMSQGAMEKYIAKAVVDQIGEAMAKDIFARVLLDAAANSTTKTGTYFETIGTALGKATAADNPVIYAPGALYYAILKEVDQNGQPIVRDGVVLGAPLKKDNAATKITVLDPKMFVLDKISETTLKVQDKAEEGCYVYAAYARAEGCMRKTNAAAFIA